jgi:hypothetical protein
MKSQPLREVKLFVKIDDLSKKKHCDAKWEWVALWAMYKRSRDDLRVVFEEQSLQFQRVLQRCSWAIFATIFSENARLFQLFKASEEGSQRHLQIDTNKEQAGEIFHRLNAVASLQEYSSCHPPNIPRNGSVGTFIGFDDLRTETAHCYR